MSALIEQEIACPHCKHPNDVEVWSAINVKEDPELKDLLLGGEINMAECVSCKEIFYAEHFLIYHDPASELMAFVYPHAYAKEKELWEKKTVDDFELTEATVPESERLTYKPVTVFGLDQLVFLVEDEEEMGIQSEIVYLLARENGMKTTMIKHAIARARQLPVVIPYMGQEGVVNRQTVLAALEKLKTVNDRLTVF